MSTHADKAGLTNDSIKYDPDGIYNEKNSSTLSSADLIKKIKTPTQIKCCPTGTLEFATSNVDGEKTYQEECCTATEATLQALKTQFSTHAPKFLVLSGSLRQESFSKKVAIESGAILAKFGAQVKVFDATDLPLFSTDIDPTSIPKVVELRTLVSWCEGMVWISPEMHGNYSAVFKNQVDWMPLSIGAIRPTQGKTCAVIQVEAGSQSFNTVNNLRVLGRWMRMIVIPNQATIPKAYGEFTSEGTLKDSSLRDRVIDVVEELYKYTLLLRDQQPFLLQRFSETRQRAQKNLQDCEKPADASILKSLNSPLVIDVRSHKEVLAKKGGEAVPGSIHVPLNVNNDPQSVHLTTKLEFKSKLVDAGIDLNKYKENGFITHCSAGDSSYIGRGARAAALLRDLGYTKAFNGGDPIMIRKVLDIQN